jgi:hypothetical protein
MIWDDLQPKTFDQVGIERIDALVASDLVASYKRVYKGADMRGFYLPPLLRVCRGQNFRTPSPKKRLWYRVSMTGLRRWRGSRLVPILGKGVLTTTGSREMTPNVRDKTSDATSSSLTTNTNLLSSRR